MKVFIFLSLLFFISITSGAQDTSIQTGCIPPIQFSIDNNCELYLYNGLAVNKYSCDSWKVIGDCKGGVVTSEENIPNHAMIYVVAAINVILVLAIILVAVRFFRR